MVQPGLPDRFLLFERQQDGFERQQAPQIAGCRAGQRNSVKAHTIGGNSRFFWRPQATRLVHRHHFGSNEERCCEKPDFELIHDFGPPGRNPTVASSAMRVPKVTPFGHDFRHMLYEPRDLMVGKMSAEARGVLRFYRLAHLVSGSPAVLRRASPGTRVAAARATRRG